jgi:hypothetical protein
MLFQHQRLNMFARELRELRRLTWIRDLLVVNYNAMYCHSIEDC